MEIENIKTVWKKMGGENKSQSEISLMTRIRNHPGIVRMRFRLIIETIFIICFLVFYYDGFDGGGKPLWANIILITSAVAYVILRTVAWLVLRYPVRGTNLRISLTRFHRSLRLIAISIWLTSIFFGTAMILFFTSSANFTKGKYFVLTGIILSLIAITYLSGKILWKRIQDIQSTITQFVEPHNS